MKAGDYYEDEAEDDFDFEKEAAKRAAREKQQKIKKQQRQRETSMPVISERLSGASALSTQSSVQKLPMTGSQMHLQGLLAQYQERQIVSKDIVQNQEDCTCCITVGNVDSGKSTIFGHLYQLLGGNSTSDEKSYAHWLDTSSQERERNVTMSVNSYYLTINERCFLMQDCPGHTLYSDSIFTQVLRPDCGIIVIESHNFERTSQQIRQHLIYLVIFAVHQIIVLVNKMDKVEYNKEKYELICQSVQKMFGELQIGSKTTLNFVPCVGSTESQNNLVDYCDKLSFAQQTVRQSLYTLRKDKVRLKHKFPSIVVIDVSMDNSIIQAHIFVDNGVLCIDDIVFAQPSMILFKISEIIQPTGVSILAPGSRALVVLQPYLRIVEGLRIADSPQIAMQAVRKGDSLELVGAMMQHQIQTKITNKIRIQLYVTEDKGLCIGDDVEAFVGIQQREAKIVAVDAILQGKEFLTTNQSFLNKGQFALVVIRMASNIVCRKMEDSKVFGRVVLRVDQRIVGFGFIMGIRKLE